MMSRLQRVPLDQIRVSELNSRKNLDAGNEDTGIDDLARSIETQGLLQPPTLRAHSAGGFEVIAGQRRLLACQRLNLAAVDAFVVDLDDNAALSASLVENLQRADMDPLDKARGFEDLVRRTGSEKEAGRLTGVRTPTLRKYLLLLSLPEDMRAILGTGDGPTGVGALSTLARLFPGDDAREAWRVVKGFTGATAERLLQQSNGDLDELRGLQQRQLDGEFDIERCGSNLGTCPWVTDLPDATRRKILDAAADRGPGGSWEQETLPSR